MSENIEIKARYPHLCKGEGIARRLGARPMGIERQRDTYFGVPPDRARQGARLKLRERWTLTAAGLRRRSAQLIPYLRPNVAAPRRSDYSILPVETPGPMRSLLSKVLGVSAVVEKQRTVFLLGNTRIHLDRVRGLGAFIEFEALVGRGRGAKVRARARVKALMAQFGVSPEALITTSYAEMARGVCG
jgi:predicted adenylyl cyclase CyaB